MVEDTLKRQKCLFRVQKIKSPQWMTMFLEIQRLIWVLSIVVHNICCFFLCLMFDNLFALVNSSLLSVKRKRKNYDKNTLPFIKSTTIFINTVFVYACLFRKAIYYKHCIHMYSMIIIYFNTTHNMFYINHLKKNRHADCMWILIFVWGLLSKIVITIYFCK